MQPSEKDVELAKILVDHSLSIKPKEKVLITVSEAGMALGKAVYLEVLKRGAYPMFDIEATGTGYTFYNNANEWQLGYVPDEIIKTKIKWADAYVRIYTENNSRELSQIDPDKIAKRSKLLRPLMDPMIDSDRWILTEYPTDGTAQEAGVSTDWLREFYFNACLVDYKKMEKDLKGLEKIMDKGSEIHVRGKMTDLYVNIKGRLAQACYGERNIPDGECFLAPVTDGVNGEVYFDLPTLAYGTEVSGINLEFKDGKVINAMAERGEAQLLKMLETDPGAKYLGEFAIGANFNIKRAMLNTLFDEKIGGTIHMALGRAYKEKRGGGENESAIHWDIVKDMRLPGSVLTIDGVEVLKEGKLLV
ncbi:aminopeptidase [Candidatus Woesebacteria bacterium]|nr:aminopeptidase [Candidatus Woesebacteria bacterium]